MTMVLNPIEAAGAGPSGGGAAARDGRNGSEGGQ